MESVVGGCESVKKTGGTWGLNFLSGVPLQRFVRLHSLTQVTFGIKRREGPVHGLQPDFVKNFTIELA